jgi:hypothetical protein
METFRTQAEQREDDFFWAFQAAWQAAGSPGYWQTMEMFVAACGADPPPLEQDASFVQFMTDQVAAGIPLNWFACVASQLVADQACQECEGVRQQVLDALADDRTPPGALGAVS